MNNSDNVKNFPNQAGANTPDTVAQAALANDNAVNEKQMKLNAVLISKKYILIDGKTGSIFAEGMNPIEAMKLLNLTQPMFVKEMIQQTIYDTFSMMDKAAEEEAKKAAENATNTEKNNG